jgi:hypothetical protein
VPGIHVQPGERDDFRLEVCWVESYIILVEIGNFFMDSLLIVG